MSAIGVPHSVLKQGGGSILCSAIVRGLFPSYVLAAMIRGLVIEKNYNGYEDDNKKRRMRGSLMYHMLVFHNEDFEKHNKAEIRRFNNEYKQSNDGILDWTELEIVDQRSFDIYIKSWSEQGHCLKLAEKFCEKQIEMINKLNEQFTVNVGQGWMNEIKPVRWDLDVKKWNDLNNPAHYIESTNDWNGASKIYSNDFDKLCGTIADESMDNNDGIVDNENVGDDEENESIVVRNDLENL